MLLIHTIRRESKRALSTLALIRDVQKLSAMPKRPHRLEEDIRARSAARRDIHESFLKLAPESKANAVRDLIKYAGRGELTPDPTYKDYATQGRFPKGAGPAVHWLASVLDHADEQTRAEWTGPLSVEYKRVAENIRRRKPWMGIVDPSFKPLTDYLKNHVAIGYFSDGGPTAQEPKRVAIVGEGLTGKLIGFLLNGVSEHIKVEYFERDGEAGGRMHTVTTKDGAHFEGGAMRIPKSGKTIHYFLKLLGIGRPGEETIPFPNMGENVPGKILYDGKVVDWPANQPFPNHPFLRSVVERFEAFSTQLREPLEIARARHDEPAMRKAWQRYIDEYSGRTVEQLLREKCGFTDKEIHAFATVGLGTGGLKSYLENGVSALELAREITADLTKGQGLLPNGARNAVQRLGTKVVERADGSSGALEQISTHYFNTEVTKISLDGGKPAVHYRTTGGNATPAIRHFDLAFVTPPPGALKSVDLEEALEPAIVDAIRNCAMMHSTKLIVQFQEPFWRDEKNGLKKGMVEVVQSDQDGLNSSYFIVQPKGKNGKPVGVGYLDYRWAKHLFEENPQAYYRAVLGTFKKIVPAMAKVLSGTIVAQIVKSWTIEGGAFREMHASRDRDHHILAGSLAPENTQPVKYASADNVIGGYTESAAIEAFRAAAAAVVQLGGKVHPDLPVFTPFDYGRPRDESSVDSSH